MTIANLVVREGLVAQKNTGVPQLIQVSIKTDDIDSGVADLEWQNVASDGATLVSEEPTVMAQIVYGSSADSLARWVPATHLVQGRIEALERLAEQGVANRLSHGMAYQLFANNLVDYADKYRGMQTVVMHGLEAFADITIKTDQDNKGGVWTVPPFFIDSVCHLAGFVMNVSDAVDTKNNFCVTPGWGRLTIARPLAAGGRYRSYVKMIPTTEDPAVYFGDVYILSQDGLEVIGLMQAMKFRRYPRVLLNRFFSAKEIAHQSGGNANGTGAVMREVTPQVKAAAPAPKTTAQVTTFREPEAATAQPLSVPRPQITLPGTAAAQASQAPPLPTPAPQLQTIELASAPALSAVAVDSESTATKAIALVGVEAGLDVRDLVDDASFAELGVDSLMSLVIAEKLREQLGVTVSGSLFLEYPTVGDLRAWLVEYYS